MVDLRQTQEYANFMQNIGWVVEKTDNINYFIRKFPIIGSFIKIQRPEKISYKVIERLSKKYRAFQIVIEPKSSYYVSRITYHNYKQSKRPFLPSKTIHIDLKKSEKQLLKKMHYKTRYNINKAKSNKLKVISSDSINTFANFWQECARKQRGMFISQKKEIIELYKAFGKNAHLVLGFNGKELISGVLMVVTKDIAYYMYAASSDKGKKLFAPTFNVWESLSLAKTLGCKIFDFEGIYDERFPLKSWKGFTRFKESFGGKEIEYPGAFMRWRMPL